MHFSVTKLFGMAEIVSCKSDQCMAMASLHIDQQNTCTPQNVIFAWILSQVNSNKILYFMLGVLQNLTITFCMTLRVLSFALKERPFSFSC